MNIEVYRNDMSTRLYCHDVENGEHSIGRTRVLTVEPGVSVSSVSH